MFYALKACQSVVEIAGRKIKLPIAKLAITHLFLWARINRSGLKFRTLTFEIEKALFGEELGGRIMTWLISVVERAQPKPW